MKTYIMWFVLIGILAGVLWNIQPDDPYWMLDSVAWNPDYVDCKILADTTKTKPIFNVECLSVD